MICTKCKKDKDESEFYFRKDSGKHRSECKDCTKAAKAIREAKPGVKEERARKERERRKLHKERINKRLREQRTTYLKEQVKMSNKNCTHKRRSTLKDGISTKELIDWEASQYPICVYCGARDNLSIDHIIPLSKGGTHTTDNLALACRSCNSSKNNRNLILFMATTN